MRAGRVTILVLGCLGCLVPAASAAKANDSPRISLFAYFKNNGGSGVYLNSSTDGQTFRPLNEGRPIFTPPDWANHQKLTRDPSIVYQDGTFHMVWTTNWEGQIFGYASSPDLREWSEPIKVRPFPESLPDDRQPKNIWAPEVHYDPIREDFFVIFSATVPAELNDGDGSADAHGNDHRMYITRTEDFRSFTEARVFFDPGYSSIDGQLVYDRRGTAKTSDDRWVMVYKHEKKPKQGGKNLRLVMYDPRTDSFSEPSKPVVGPGSRLSGDWAEGPSLLKHHGSWWLYWDAYTEGYYGLARSANLDHWVERTDRLRMGVEDPRHGVVFRAPADAVGWSLGR